MPDPRLLPLLDLIAENIAAAVIAERAQAEPRKELPRAVTSGHEAGDANDANPIRPATATG